MWFLYGVSGLRVSVPGAVSLLLVFCCLAAEFSKSQGIEKHALDPKPYTPKPESPEPESPKPESPKAEPKSGGPAALTLNPKASQTPQTLNP